jgi:hypothetical protein
MRRLWAGEQVSERGAETFSPKKKKSKQIFLKA